MTKQCNHDWMPYPPNQTAKYKCLNCSVLGYAQNVLMITARTCMVPGCKELAVDTIDGVRLCIEHRNERKK